MEALDGAGGFLEDFPDKNIHIKIILIIYATENKWLFH